MDNVCITEVKMIYINPTLLFYHLIAEVEKRRHILQTNSLCRKKMQYFLNLSLLQYPTKSSFFVCFMFEN